MLWILEIHPSFFNKFWLWTWFLKNIWITVGKKSYYTSTANHRNLTTNIAYNTNNVSISCAIEGLNWLWIITPCVERILTYKTSTRLMPIHSIYPTPHTYHINNTAMSSACKSLSASPRPILAAFNVTTRTGLLHLYTFLWIQIQILASAHSVNSLTTSEHVLKACILEEKERGYILRVKHVPMNPWINGLSL